MATISKAHPVRVALVFCAVAATAALPPAPATANADPLGGLVGQVEEVVSPVVQATPPVQQVAETVTSTAQGVTMKITPSVAKTADAASATGVPSATGAATQAAEGAVHRATEEAEAATRSALPDPPVSSVVLDPATAPPASSAASPSAPAPTNLPPAPPRTTYVPPPGNDGSTGAPLPRWIAYVWPAVALTGPSLANFGESWGKAIVRLATGASGGNGAEGGVAGVHASGGRPEASSDPLFSRLPSDVAQAFTSVPTPAFIYLGLVLLAVIAVGLAVRREIVVGRRH